MIVVCISKSGVIFLGAQKKRAEYGDMFEGKATFDGYSEVYQIDIGAVYTPHVRLKAYWRPARNLEIDLWYNGHRNLNKILKY